MKIRTLLPGLFCFVGMGLVGQESTIELKNNFFFIDGQKFFIKGIGYEVGAYPGMVPWAHPFNADILRSDLQRIRDAGFNTIRTWNAFTDQELAVVKEYNLKIIMGVWVDPFGDFSDPSYLDASLQQVGNVLSYSKNYDNIIGYLIMNEPIPDHIFDVGYSYLYAVWKQIIQLIHTKHPGVPVSIANTCVGDFIDPQIFDFSAYNIYSYNPATVNFSHRYPAYVNSIFSQRTDDHPLVVTEYGLSVSPSGPGNWGYGGNTVLEQEEGIHYMYRSLIDGRASGSCIFNYSDGWWKAGNEFIHDDAAEEWFGLIEYQSVDDIYGIPRIAWDSVTVYNRAIIYQPRNEEIYTCRIPIELFVQDTITRFEVFDGNAFVMDGSIVGNYFFDTLSLSPGPMNGYILRFDFFNSANHLMKTESINLLASDDPVELPAINITVTPEPEQGDQSIHTDFEIVNTGPLQTNYTLDYVFYTHIGWDYGDAATTNLSEENPFFSTDYNYSSVVNVLSIAAGMDATFGSFRKRISTEKIFLLGDTSHTDPPALINMHAPATGSIRVYPNPAIEYITIETDHDGRVSCQIADVFGRICLECDFVGEEAISINQLAAGYYFIFLKDSNRLPVSIGFLKRNK